jgi:hypothetical protein
MSDPHLEADLVEAGGRGAELFEAPALFYLTHADTIRRWSALRARARDATNLYLSSIQTDLETIDGLGNWEVIARDTARSYRHVLAAPPGTPPADDGAPAIACCFGWNQRAVRLTQHTWMPFVGIRVGAGAERDLWRRTFLDGDGRDLRPTVESLGYHRDKEWPVWQAILGGDGWWAELDDYREKVVGAFERCHSAFGRDVERTVEALAGGNSVAR